MKCDTCFYNNSCKNESRPIPESIQCIDFAYLPNPKQIEGKPDFFLIPTQIIREIEEVRQYGTKKYGDSNNWRKVDVQEYKKAALRHMIKLWEGEGIDPESGLKHWSHLACNIAFILEMEK